MLLPAKEANVKSKLLPEDCKSLCFYSERKQPIEDWIEISGKRPLGSGVGQLVVKPLKITCRLSIALSYSLSIFYLLYCYYIDIALLLVIAILFHPIRIEH